MEFVTRSFLIVYAMPILRPLDVEPAFVPLPVNSIDHSAIKMDFQFRFNQILFCSFFSFVCAQENLLYLLYSNRYSMINYAVEQVLLKQNCSLDSILKHYPTN